MQPELEAVEIVCPVCQGAAAVYVPSNLVCGDLKIDCYGCGDGGVINYDTMEYSDGKVSERISWWKRIFNGE